MSNFSFDNLATILRNKPDNEIISTEACQYFSTYFKPLHDGNHAYFCDGKFEVMEDAVFRKTYLGRAGKDITKWYLHDNTNLMRLGYELNKPALNGNMINLCPQFKHKYKPFAEFSEETKRRVDVFLNFVFEIICDKHESQYKHLINWLATMVKGKKNSSIPYLRGLEGIGKSTLTDYLRDFVLGKDLVYRGGSAPLLTQFNLCIAGKLLVIFEELENVSSQEWMKISSKLKDMTTSTTYMVEDKYMKKCEVKNLNNYMINTNNNSVQDANGRRINEYDVSHERREDHTYFANLIREIHDDEVGHAVFCYLMEVNTDNYQEQAFVSERRKLAKLEKLDSVERFLKYEYVKKEKDINMKCKDLFLQYNDFMVFNKHLLSKYSPEIKIGQFYEKIQSHGIPKVKDNTNYYRCKYESLKKYADKHMWLHETDEDTHSNSTGSWDELAIVKKENADLLLRNKELEARIQELEGKPVTVQIKPEPKKKIILRKVQKVVAEPEPVIEAEATFPPPEGVGSQQSPFYGETPEPEPVAGSEPEPVARPEPEPFALDPPRPKKICRPRFAKSTETLVKSNEKKNDMTNVMDDVLY